MLPSYIAETHAALDRPHKVLVADDDLIMGEFLSSILSAIADVQVVTSGEAAVEAVLNNEFDVVLLDIEMPGMGGLAACKIIKDMPQTSGISVIIVTSRQGEIIEVEALDLGASDFITKPFVAKVVLARVRNHLISQWQARQLRMLSMIDGLTGIANRRQFDDVIQAEFYRAKRLGTPLSLMIIDVDFFKQYNDAYGHVEGDQCLKLLASTFTKLAKRAGDLVARIGGEEFAMIFPRTDLPQLSLLAKTVSKSVESLRLQHVHGVGGVVTVSIGAIMIDTRSSACSKNEFIERADQFLYQAKAAGRNGFSIGKLD